MKRAAAIASAIFLLAPCVFAAPSTAGVGLTARMPQTFTTPDGTRYVFSPDGLATLVERPGGARDLLVSGSYAQSVVAASAPASTGTCPGLYYTGARYYNPCLGIFLTRDPAPVDVTDPASLNPYVYGKANPVRYVDPTGRQAVPPDDVYFRDQELNALAPAEQARLREADARSAVGRVLGAAEFFAQAAWGTLTAAVGYRSEETGERIVEAVSDPPRALEEAKEGVQQTVAEAERLAAAGEDLQAGRVFTRDLVAPAATAVLTVGELSRRAGACLYSHVGLAALPLSRPPSTRIAHSSSRRTGHNSWAKCVPPAVRPPSTWSVRGLGRPRPRSRTSTPPSGLGPRRTRVSSMPEPRPTARRQSQFSKIQVLALRCVCTP